MIDPRVASGLRDLPPATMIPRERMLDQFRTTFARFGFVPIETPHIERTEVLTGKGAGSEEVLRQIFDVTNKGGESGKLALRFDLTVPLARFIAKHVDQLGVPFKRYAIGSVFRGERPAKGRFREFTQCDFDIVGTESEVADAEIVQVIYSALAAVDVPDFTIALNHRGILDGLMGQLDLADRTGSVLRSLDKLAKIGRDKVRDELIDPEGHARLNEDQADRVLDFVEQGQGGLEVLERAEEILSASDLAGAGIARLRAVLTQIAAAEIPTRRIRIDLGLARGLDYYTGVVFETTVDGWERFGSIASGGRYDNLASLFTSRRLPGVGASIGLDRLLALLQESDHLPETGTTSPILIVRFPEADIDALTRMAVRLRRAGIGTELFPDAISLGKQLGYASNRGHRHAIIAGPAELSAGVFNLRDLATRKEQRGIVLDDLERVVASALNAPTDPPQDPKTGEGAPS